MQSTISRTLSLNDTLAATAGTFADVHVTDGSAKGFHVRSNRRLANVLAHAVPTVAGTGLVEVAGEADLYRNTDELSVTHPVVTYDGREMDLTVTAVRSRSLWTLSVTATVHPTPYLESVVRSERVVVHTDGGWDGAEGLSRDCGLLARVAQRMVASVVTR